MNARELAKLIKEDIKWLLEEDAGCCTHKLDDHLAVCVGWLSGYDENDKTIIHSPSEPEWGIVAGILVYTSDDLRTDFEFINMPYYPDGEVWDTVVSITPEEQKSERALRKTAEWLLNQYKEMKNLEISDEGEILTPREEEPEEEEPEEIESEEEVEETPTEVEVEDETEVEESLEEDKINYKEKIEVYCYSSKPQLFNSRDKAIAFYKDAARNSEGAEQERYVNVLFDLEDGLNIAWDQVTDLPLEVWKKYDAQFSEESLEEELKKNTFYGIMYIIDDAEERGEVFDTEEEAKEFAKTIDKEEYDGYRIMKIEAHEDEDGYEEFDDEIVIYSEYFDEDESLKEEKELKEYILPKDAKPYKVCNNTEYYIATYDDFDRRMMGNKATHTIVTKRVGGDFGIGSGSGLDFHSEEEAKKRIDDMLCMNRKSVKESISIKTLSDKDKEFVEKLKKEITDNLTQYTKKGNSGKAMYYQGQLDLLNRLF